MSKFLKDNFDNIDGFQHFPNNKNLIKSQSTQNNEASTSQRGRSEETIMSNNDCGLPVFPFVRYMLESL